MSSENVPPVGLYERRMRRRQPVYFHSRWAHCKHCGTCRKYEVKAVPQRSLPGLGDEKPRRLKDTPCARCGKLLGRGANKRARGLEQRRAKRMQADAIVSKITQRLAFPSATLRSAPRASGTETPVETSADAVARRMRAGHKP